MKKIFCLIVLCGCGLKTSFVEKKNVDVPQLPAFALTTESRLKFNKVTTFLWKEQLDGPTVATVNKLSYRIGQLDVMGEALKEKMVPVEQIKSEKLDLRREQKALQKELAQKEKEKMALEKELSELPEDADPQIKQALMVKVETLTQELVSLKVKYENRNAEILSRISEIDAEVSEKEPDLAKEQEAITQEAIERIAALKSLVDWYEEQPTEIGLLWSESGQPQVYIRGWNPEDGAGARTLTSFHENNVPVGFSPDEKTDWQSIHNVQYSERGGKLSFTVHLARGISYKFETARSEINDPLGRMIYSGEISRFRLGEPTRYGIIKFYR